MSDELTGLVPEEEGIVDQDLIDEVENTVTPPSMTSEEWHGYLISQFADHELENGNPINHGLVRVAEKLVGPIVDRQIMNFTSAHKDNYGTSTVHVRLTLAVTNELHPLAKIVDVVNCDGIAEVNSRNTPSPFNNHPSSSAYTKAESQALRKLLRLRGVSADEVTPDDMVLEGDVYVPETPISEEQIQVIDLVCKRANVNVLDFISSGEIKYMFIEQVPSHKGQAMIKFLNEIQSQKKESPVKKPYDGNWRETNMKRRQNESTD